MASDGGVALGVRANGAQFALVLVVTCFVGAMVGLERSVLPAIAEHEFGLVARSAVLSFIVAFGITKAAANYFAGRLAGVWGRKGVLIAGWLVALPVPWLLIGAPRWEWVVFANVLLGASQGLCWSTTVIMNIDLAGPSRRGLAMGLNEFCGYVSVAASAFATGVIASHFGLRPEPFYLGIGYTLVGLGLSAFVLRDTKDHASSEARLDQRAALPPRSVFVRTSLTDRQLSSITQAGFVRNLNDGMAWGLFPLIYAASGLSLVEIGALAAIYPAVWGVLQLGMGALSDRVGRKWLIAGGMWTQAAAIACMVAARGVPAFAVAAVLLGVGTAMVYPTLLAAVGDVAHPSWRSAAVGVYRLWRDLGYAAGALIAGFTADALGIDAALIVVAALSAVSGLIVAIRLRETRLTVFRLQTAVAPPEA